MDEKLRNDLILLAITLIMSAIAWFLKGIWVDVRELRVSNAGKVGSEQHNELAKSLREAIKATDLEVREIRTRVDIAERQNDSRGRT